MKEHTCFCCLVSLPFYGVQRNLNPAALPNGWSQCYRGTYAIYLNGSELTSLLSACSMNKLLLACRPVGNTTFTVAAMGLRADVLVPCNTTTNCTRVANGVGWYYSDNWSWGFVNSNDIVIRTSCDTNMVNPSYGLCWHTGQGAGGYQCGIDYRLNSATNFERIIYQSSWKYLQTSWTWWNLSLTLG